MTVTDPRCQRAVFADRILSLRAAKGINNMYGWFCLSKRIHLYRELSDQLMSLAKGYLKLN